MLIHLAHLYIEKWILPKIRALMTATVKMTGRIVGNIMAGGIGAGTVVTTGTLHWSPRS